jgi:hypothetical protein
MLSDPADPYSGRYSLKILIPTAVPVWVLVPLLKKHAPGPLANGTTYELSLWARSSPRGATIFFIFGAMANSTETTGLTPMGTAPRQWMKMTTTFHVPPTTTNPSDGDHDGDSNWDKPPASAVPQLMFAPAQSSSCGGCQNLGAEVWIDDVTIRHKTRSKSDDDAQQVQAAQHESTASAGTARKLRLHVHNPHNVVVKTVHMVVSSHFDAGCKTPGCGVLAPGEPDKCAKVGPHWRVDPDHTGEPFAYHIVNRYFDEFFPRAIALAEQGRQRNVSYRYMTQSWLVSLFLDCDHAGMLSWPGSGHARVGTPLLHCPNASAVAALKSALRRGDLFFHGFSSDNEASVYPDASLFEAAITVGERVSDELGLPRPRSVSQRDVPGWTRAALPLLNKHGIHGLSFGAGTPPGKVDVPPLSVWRDLSSNASVVLTYETAYGTDATLFVLPSGDAMCAAWAGDNTGPPPLEEVMGFYESLKGRFPQADIQASTFDAFFAVANRPEIRAQLPVVTAEIEDAWIYGVPSDPLKNAQFREASRQRLACLESGQCSSHSVAMQRFERLLVKVPEHTWGVAQGWFLPDNVNWTNVQFDAARAQQPLGFVSNNAQHADYNSTVGSWIEQRTFVTGAPALLATEYPELASNISTALRRLERVVPPSTEGLQQLDLNSTITCGGVRLRFGAGGGLTSLRRRGVEWAGGEQQPLGQFVYETFQSADFNSFLHDMGSRIGDRGTWPSHTAGPYANYTRNTSDLSCGNFCKNNMSSADPQRRTLRPSLTALFELRSGADAADGSTDITCEYIAKGTLPVEAHTLAGAPRSVVIKLRVSGGAVLDWELYQLDKRPTRLAEATFFSFVPDLSARPDGRWSLSVLGSRMDPADTLGHVAEGTGSASSDYLHSVYGGSPHLRGVESASWEDAHAGNGGFTLI